MSHYHVERVTTTSNSSLTERVGRPWATWPEANIAVDRLRMVSAVRDGKYQVGDLCHCPAELNAESATRLLSSLHDRVQRIEARQRAYGQHDPDCQSDPIVKPGFNNLLPKKPCSCWLSTPDEQ
jgi:hypothetical protein